MIRVLIDAFCGQTNIDTLIPIRHIILWHTISILLVTTSASISIDIYLPFILFVPINSFFMFKFYKLMGAESYTIIKIKMSITLLIKSTFLSVNSRTVFIKQNLSQIIGLR